MITSSRSSPCRMAAGDQPTMNPVISRAEARDHDATRRVIAAAYGSDAEAELVGRIRASPEYEPPMEVVAEVDDLGVVGHGMISRTLLRSPDATERSIVMLSPLAVDPAAPPAAAQVRPHAVGSRPDLPASPHEPGAGRGHGRHGGSAHRRAGCRHRQEDAFRIGVQQPARDRGLAYQATARNASATRRIGTTPVVTTSFRSLVGRRAGGRLRRPAPSWPSPR